MPASHQPWPPLRMGCLSTQLGAMETWTLQHMQHQSSQYLQVRASSITMSIFTPTAKFHIIFTQQPTPVPASPSLLLYPALNVVFKLEVEIGYPIFRTTEVVVLRTTESLSGIKPSSPATSLNVLKCVGTSQSGGWMSILEVVDIGIDTLLTSKCGGHHPL